MVILFHTASIKRGVDELLPGEVTASKDAIHALNQCCAEFVSLVSSEASTLADGERLMKPEHVTEALKTLGFDAYINEGNGAVVEAKEMRKERLKKRQSFRGPKFTKEEEEELAQKQRVLLKE
ncbi:unnamed protein product, partial [Discosporangium mesarthrocarpum]